MHSSEQERNRGRYSPPSDLRPIAYLPRGLELMRPNGIFYPLEAGTRLIESADGYVIGIQDTNGVLRPIFAQRIIVKVKKLGTELYDIVPLTLEEYRNFDFNSDITTHTDRFIRFIGQLRGRANN